MKILICGSQGYIGCPLYLTLKDKGHTVFGVDNFSRINRVKKLGSDSITPVRSDTVDSGGDICDYDFLQNVFMEFRPECIINLAQQPSAAWSMINPGTAWQSIQNNVQGFLNILWCMREYVPMAQVITLGTMGEYGFPNMDIPEGFFKCDYRGMSDIMLFPRQPGSIYHTSKVMATDLGWMICKAWELRITDVMQGIVYGTSCGGYLTRFDIDECFGTMINRAVASVIIDHPVLVYGTGEQTRGYIALQDSIKCLSLFCETPINNENSVHGYRIVNQMDCSYSCFDVAKMVCDIGKEFGFKGRIKNILNPRIEPEVHYYNPDSKKLHDMGWGATEEIGGVIRSMFKDLIPFKSQIEKYKNNLLPNIKWRPANVAIKEI